MRLASVLYLQNCVTSNIIYDNCKFNNDKYKVPINKYVGIN